MISGSITATGMIDGENGYSTAVVQLFRRYAPTQAEPTPALPTGTLTYTFSTGVLSGATASFNGWSQQIPATQDGTKLFVTMATARSQGATDDIIVDSSVTPPVNEWSTPVEYVADGMAYAPVTIYKRSASQPNDKPDNNARYYFKTVGSGSSQIKAGTLVAPSGGSLNGWSTEIPATDGNPCWTRQATALAHITDDYDEIGQGEWSDPATKFVEDGAAGTSPWIADIDNEMDSVACDKDGKPTSTQTVQTNVVLYYGSEKKNFSVGVYKDKACTQAYSNTSTLSNGIAVWWTSGNAQSNTVNVKVSSDLTIAGKLTVYIKLAAQDDSNITRVLSFIINGIRPGANGDPAVVYNILPSLGDVNVGRTADGGYTPRYNTLTCGYKKNAGGTPTTVDDVTGNIDSTYRLFFRRRTRATGQTETTWESTYYSYINSNYRRYLVVTSGYTASGLDALTYDAVEFILYKNTSSSSIQVSDIDSTKIIDRETVPVVADGEKGPAGTKYQRIYKSLNVYPCPSSQYPSGDSPSGWSTSPTAITSDARYRYISERSSEDGGSTWTSWSTPQVDAYLSEDGRSFTVIGQAKGVIAWGGSLPSSPSEGDTYLMNNSSDDDYNVWDSNLWEGYNAAIGYAFIVDGNLWIKQRDEATSSLPRWENAGRIQGDTIWQAQAFKSFSSDPGNDKPTKVTGITAATTDFGNGWKSAPQSDTEVTIGSNSSTNQNIPTNSYYKYCLSEQIYTSSEIGRFGKIESLSFYNTGGSQTRNIDIYIKSTTKSSFSSGADWIAAELSDRVFSGTVTFGSNAWTKIKLDKAFNYQSGNIVIIIDDNTGSYTSAMACSVFSSSGSTLYLCNDSINYDPLSPTMIGNELSYKNHIKIGFSSQVYSSIATVQNGTTSPTGTAADWSTPTPWQGTDGQDGENGKDGAYYVDDYGRASSRSLSNGYPEGFDSTTGWTSTAPATNDTYKYIWMRSRLYNPNTDTYGTASYVCLTGIQGQQGTTGKMFYPMGTFDKTKTYTRTGNYIPLVFFDDGVYNNVSGERGHYYFLAADSNYYNGSSNYAPASTDGNGNSYNYTSGIWTQATDFGLVITQGIFAEFAKLGAAIMSGDFLFSQYGASQLSIGSNTSISRSSTYAIISGLSSFKVKAGREYTIRIKAKCNNVNVPLVLRYRSVASGLESENRIIFGSTSYEEKYWAFVSEFDGEIKLVYYSYNSSYSTGGGAIYSAYLEDVSNYTNLSPTFVNDDEIVLVSSGDTQVPFIYNDNGSSARRNNRLVTTPIYVISGKQYKIRLVATRTSGSGYLYMRFVRLTATSTDASTSEENVTNGSNTITLTANYTGYVLLYGRVTAGQWDVGETAVSAIEPFISQIVLDLLSGYGHFSGGKTRFYQDGHGQLAGGNIRWNAKGAIKVTNMSHSVLIHGEEDVFYCYDDDVDPEYGHTYPYVEGQYYANSELDTYWGDYNLRRCTGSMDIIVIPSSGNDTGNVDVYLPNAKDYEGKIVEIIDSRYTQPSGSTYVGTLKVYEVDEKTRMMVDFGAIPGQYITMNGYYEHEGGSYRLLSYYNSNMNDYCWVNLRH